MDAQKGYGNHSLGADFAIGGGAETTVYPHGSHRVDVSQKWKVLYRFPPKGPPLVIIMESATGFLVKLPAVTNRDHVVITKESSALGKHLTDETIKTGEGRHQPLGKMKATTVPTALLEALSVELKDDEPIYVLENGPNTSFRSLEKKDVPSRDLVPKEELLEKFATVDLDSNPALRKTTWGEARRSSLPHGMRKEGSDLVLYIQRLNGKVIRFPFIASIDTLPVVSNVTGLGALFDRARQRLPDSSSGDGSKS